MTTEWDSVDDISVALAHNTGAANAPDEPRKKICRALRISSSSDRWLLGHGRDDCPISGKAECLPFGRACLPRLCAPAC